MALKNLFGKLAGKADDIADVARYADDVAESVKHGDDWIDRANVIEDWSYKLPKQKNRFVDIPDSLGKGTLYEGGVIVSPDDPMWKYGVDIDDDVVNPLVADNAGRAVMSPDLVSDDFLDAIDSFAYHTPNYDSVVDNTSHILGSVPPRVAHQYRPHSVFPIHSGKPRTLEDFYTNQQWLSHLRDNPEYAATLPKDYNLSFKELVERQRDLSYPKYKYPRFSEIWTDDDLPF